MRTFKQNNLKINLNFIDNKNDSWEKNSVESTTNSISDPHEFNIARNKEQIKKTWMKKVIPKKSKEEWLVVIKDSLIFYSTAFSVVLSILSITAMMFLVPFFIDPAWSTLKADFNENGTTCYTKTGFERKGMKKKSS